MCFVPNGGIEPLPKASHGLVDVHRKYWDYDKCSAVVQVDKDTWEGWISLYYKKPMEGWKMLCGLLIVGGVFFGVGCFLSAAFLWLPSGTFGSAILMFFSGIPFMVVGGFLLHKLYKSIGTNMKDEWEQAISIYRKEKFFNALSISSKKKVKRRGNGKSYTYTIYFFRIDIDFYKLRKKERFREKLENEEILGKENKIEKYRIILESLKVRSGRDFASKIVGTLPRNTVVTVKEHIGHRYHIVSPLEGWLYYEDAKGNIALESLKYRIILESLKVRSGKDLKSDIVGTLPRNTVVTVKGHIGRRYHIVSPLEGWLSYETAKGTITLESVDNEPILEEYVKVQVDL